MNERNRGFTLIELVIVIGILGILVAVVITVLNPKHYLAKSRDARRQSDLKMIQAALEAYYSQNNKYPQITTDFKFGSPWSGYLATVPQDPQNIVGDPTSPTYCYELIGGDQGYILCAKPELGISGGSTTRGASCTAAYTYCLEDPF